MGLKDEFQQAAEKANNLSHRPSNQDLLKLYSLYKQATEGDLTGERPEGFDFKAIAKYDAWKSLAGTSEESAMQSYIELVNHLISLQNS